ncbi:MAG: GNAT family N-acetyltransferase [Bacteroidota bacterium]
MSPPAIYIHEATTDSEFDAVFAIREEVFQEEHQIKADDELYGNDHISHHFLAEVDGQFVGTGRWRISLGGKVRMERLAVRPAFRGRGIARVLMEHMLRRVPQNREVYLHAPLDTVGFYQKLGFRSRGDSFLEAGLEHIEMSKM